MIDKASFLQDQTVFHSDSKLRLSIIEEIHKDTFFSIIGPIEYAKSERTKQYLSQILWDELNDEDHITFAICLPGSEECIGYCQYKFIRSERIDIGIELLPEYRGKGYGYHACRVLVDEYFSKTDNSRLLYKVKRQNDASIALVKKLGGVFTEAKYSSDQLYGAIEQIEEHNEDDLLENGRRIKEAIDSGFAKEKQILRESGAPEDILIFEIAGTVQQVL